MEGQQPPDVVGSASREVERGSLVASSAPGASSHESGPWRRE